MGMNETPSGERVHIGFFGRRNAGKSSLVNAFTNQELSVVSETKGTTTDPVRKSMELLPLGPVLIIDTPGFDDKGSLGELRVRKTRQELNRTDIAVLVVDAKIGLQECDRELIGLFREKELPWITVYNKADLLEEAGLQLSQQVQKNEIYVSALQGMGIDALKEKIASLLQPQTQETGLVEGIVHAGDMVLLVIPIDKAAPKGRLILPEQMAIRDILDHGGVAISVRESELESTISRLPEKPALVITDSQVFGFVSKVLPEDIPLTSFSILMARHKGFLETAVRGAAAIRHLQDGDTVLISEGCTHHRQCGDIGTVKLPAWLHQYTGKQLRIETTSGRAFPDELPYALVLHCGGCMLNGKEVRYRMKNALDQGVPFTNYGTAIACMHGILRRSLSVFPSLQELISEEEA